MKIADLQGRVELQVRHDLPAGYHESALQDAARFVAAKSGALRAFVTTVLQNGGYETPFSTLLSAVSERTILRITRVWVAPKLDPDSRLISQGVITVLPDPTLQPEKGFMVQAQAGTVTYLTDSYASRVGDVFQVQSGQWVWIPFRKFRVLKDKGLEYLNRVMDTPHLSDGYPDAYGYDKDNLSVYPCPESDVPMRIEYSYVPVRDFEDVDFPVDAEWALINMAKSYIARMPNKSGGGVNLRLAQLFEAEGMAEILQVRHIAEGGYGDTYMAPPGIFGA